MSVTIIPFASATLTGTGWVSWGAGYSGSTYNAEYSSYCHWGNGSSYASWVFTGLTTGTSYKLALSWHPQSNLATAAPWTISDDSGVLESGTVNQTAAATADFTAGSPSCPFQQLGSAVAIVTGTTLTVKITNNNPVNQYMTADAALLYAVPFQPWLVNSEDN